MGSFGTRYNEIDKYCNYSVTNNSISGIACAHLAKSDSSYFKKAIKYK